MKELFAKNMIGFDPECDFAHLKLHPIDSENWSPAWQTTASFGISYDLQHIFLRFRVRETNILARYKHINDPVYEDSWVEFFISFEKDAYYNLEFNCIGTVYGAYGRNREKRARLDEKLLGTIQTNPSLGRNKLQIIDRKTEWMLDVIIPISVFKFSNLGSFKDITAYGNFYKCGDKLKVPHYLSWNPIIAEKPDFHRPEYFGKLKFE
jgi:hypothetical protein